MNQAKIPQKQLNECIKITKFLINSPGCSIFKTPVDPIQDNLVDYFDKIKSPQDLGTILERLSNGNYNSINNWKNDINLVFDNARKYFGPHSFITVLSNSMENKFNKIYSKIFFTSSENWMNEINNKFHKINRLMKSAPGNLKSEFEGKRFTGPMSQAELQNLADAASSLTDQSHIFEMAQLMNKFGAKIDMKKEEQAVVLKNLPTEAVSALQYYVKDRFRVLHKHYPV